MENDVYRGKTMGFSELLTSYDIEIPIIQRDYAQGRKNQKEIRDNFLNTLLGCVQNNEPIKLDFIYGSKVKDYFQPLDGQQRLTTLFLLYWYAANKEGKSTDARLLLSKFTYETRITSREFCVSLSREEVDLGDVGQKLSDKIVDSNWFFLSWKNDPTVDSMLRTLDGIHSRFFQIADLWTKLTTDDKLISFYFVELENIGLTDDLYIKMNARGKLLTSFENFKASFQKYIVEGNWEEGTAITETFAHNIDTKWTDYFWKHFRKQNTIDGSFMRFIASVAMIRMSIDRTVNKADERAQLLTILQEEPNAVKPDHFTKESFIYLVSAFELYNDILSNKVDLSLGFPMWRHRPESTILSEIVFDDNRYSTVQKNSATYTQKVLFFAQTEYLLKSDEFNIDLFRDWMRVVRNIVSRADIDKDGNRPDIIRSPQAFDGGINLINELSEGCEDIYTFLSNSPVLKSQFAREQIIEESRKARLISSNPGLREVIFKAENNELLRGKIQFIFYTMGFDGDPDKFDTDLFIDISQVFDAYFNSEESLNNEIRRAMLTIEVDGKFEFYGYWWSYWFVGEANKRRLFAKFRELEYFLNSDFKEYFKKLVLLLIDKTPAEIIENFKPPINFPNWKLRLINEGNLMDEYGASKYIAIVEDESFCYLLKSKRPRDIEGGIVIK